MFYFEPNFIEKFHWESGSNFGHRTVFAKKHFFNILFADLWLF